MEVENNFLKQMINTYYRPTIDKQENLLKNIRTYLLYALKNGKLDKENTLHLIKLITEVIES